MCWLLIKLIEYCSVVLFPPVPFLPCLLPSFLFPLCHPLPTVSPPLNHSLSPPFTPIKKLTLIQSTSNVFISDTGLNVKPISLTSISENWICKCRNLI